MFLKQTEFYDLGIELYGVINIEETTVNFLETKIEIRMKKADEDCHWKIVGIPSVVKMKNIKEDHPKVEVDDLVLANKLNLTPTKPAPVMPSLHFLFFLVFDSS